ncbi:MAG: MogA/MoaB family molybdenum cofactor biosynthesis protein [Candidatus Bathyarchaeia archaeon]
MSETSRIHKSKARNARGVLVVTCSTSRSRHRQGSGCVQDPSGDLIESRLREHGHRVHSRRLLPDDRDILLSTLREALQDPEVDSIIVTGGTGISEDDVTIEVAEQLFDKELPGFGEFFRRISYDEIGSAALLTRAAAGIASRKPVFCIPGSTDAVARALDKLILPELPHILLHSQGS